MIRRLINRLRIRAEIKSNRRWVEREGRKERKHQSRMAVRDLIGRTFVADPFRIPDEARSRSWAACHLFPAGVRIERNELGIGCSEPPLALVCPECDLKQPAMHQGEARKCGYCGSSLHSHGSRIFHWFGTETPAEWTYQPNGGAK